MRPIYQQPTTAVEDDDSRHYLVFYRGEHLDFLIGLAIYQAGIERLRQIVRFGFRAYNKAFRSNRGGLFDVGNALPLINVKFRDVTAAEEALEAELVRLRGPRAGTAIVLYSSAPNVKKK